MAAAPVRAAPASATRSRARLPALGLAVLAVTVALHSLLIFQGDAFSFAQGLRPRALAGSGAGAPRGLRSLLLRRASLLVGAAALAVGAAAHAGALGAASQLRARFCVERGAKAVRSVAMEVATPCSRLLQGFLGSPTRLARSALRRRMFDDGDLGTRSVSDPVLAQHPLNRPKPLFCEGRGRAEQQRPRSCPADRTRPRPLQPTKASSSPDLPRQGSWPTDRPRPLPLTLPEDESPSPSRSSAASRSRTTPASRTAREADSSPATAGASLSTLTALFDLADARGQGALDVEDLRTALPLLNARLHIDLEADDVVRLYGFLKASGPGPVSQNQFVKGLRELTAVLHRMGSNISTRQLKTCLVAAFDRFDENGDGSISLNEFLVTADMLGLKIDLQEASCLYRFFSGDGSTMQQEALVNEPPLSEKWASLLDSSVAKMKDKYGWTSMEQAFTRAQVAFKEPGTAPEKVERALRAAWDAGAEDLCDVAELAADAAGLAMAAGYVSNEVQEQLNTGAIQDLSIMSVAPFAVCLGLFAVNVSKQFDELVPKEMTPDEALLYAQQFKKHEFSQAEFRRVLGCPGCRWATARPGEVLNPDGDSSVKLIVKGRMEVFSPSSPGRGRGALLGPGSSVGAVGFLRGRELWHREVLRATEEVVYISWDPEGLQMCLQHDSELSLKMDALLAGTFSANFRAVMNYRRPQAAPGRQLEGRSGPAARPARGAAPPPQPLDDLGFGGVLDAMGLTGESAVCRDDVRDFLARVDGDLSPGTASGLGKQLYEWLDKDGDGKVSCDEFRSQMHDLERCLQVLNGITMDELMCIFTKGTLTEEDLQGLMGYVDGTLCIGTSDEDCARLFRHVDQNGDGEVTMKEFANKLVELTDCLESLQGLTLQELTTLLHRAFQQFDTNNDGFVCSQEFVEAVRRLKIPLNEEQAMTLHSYLDLDKDGQIDLGEWQTGNTIPKWLEALQVTLESEAKRRGITKIGYFAEVVHSIAHEPGDLMAKGRRLLDRLWDGTNELFDATNIFTDSVGVFAALSGIWQEVSGIGSLAEIDEMDLLPFLIFLGISSTKMVRHIAEGQVSDLSAQEALVYATVFQKEGFSVTEFRRLLSYGAQWEEVAPGQEAKTQGQARALRLVVRGECVTEDEAGRRLAPVAVGGFLGGLEGQQEHERLYGAVARAATPTTLLTWDEKALESRLKSDQGLRLKVARHVTISMADRLLGAKERDETPLDHDRKPGLPGSAGRFMGARPEDA